MTTPAPVRAAILAGCAAGDSYQSIARRVGVHHHTVSRIARAAGYALRKGGRRCLLSERQDQAIALLVPTMGLWAAADVLGLEDGTVRLRARRLGVFPPAGASPDADVAGRACEDLAHPLGGAVRASYGLQQEQSP